ARTRNWRRRSTWRSTRSRRTRQRRTSGRRTRSGPSRSRGLLIVTTESAPGPGLRRTRMKESLLFLGQAVRHWRTAGTFTQSRPALARAIADAAGDVPDGQVLLELGPGTGVVTRELVRRYPR